MILIKYERKGRNFPGRLVVKTFHSNAGDIGSTPGQEAKIPHASWLESQNIKEEPCCNRYNKDFKMAHIKKKKSKKLY